VAQANPVEPTLSKVDSTLHFLSPASCRNALGQQMARDCTSFGFHRNFVVPIAQAQTRVDTSGELLAGLSDTAI
jgi:hypothetical protein